MLLKVLDMGLNKLGSYITQYDIRNSQNAYGENSVVGLSTQKSIIETKANLSGVNLASYKLFSPMSFAYVPDTSRRGDKISLAFNMTDSTYLVSSIYVVFTVSDLSCLNPWYLFMFYNRPEFDRYSRFNSWGSAREVFSWDDMCDIEIDLPPLSVQQKYVDIYKAMVANQQSYERGLVDLKLVCDGYIEDLRRKVPCEKIGQNLTICDCKNDIGLSVESVRGISTGKEFIFTKANMDGVSLSNYKIVKPKQIAYVADTSRRGNKISLAINDTQDDYLVSSISIVFDTNKDKLLPEYLMLFFTRPEFDRYTRFNSWGSARETFEWDDMCNVEIPIPDISIQKAIADIYKVYTTRKQINEQLKEQIKNICPILIKGSLEEGK